MQKKVPQEVIELARKHGYDTAEYFKRWKGYDVYCADYDGDEAQYVGLPQYILVKDGKAKITKGDEGSNLAELL